MSLFSYPVRAEKDGLAYAIGRSALRTSTTMNEHERSTGPSSWRADGCVMTRERTPSTSKPDDE